jgi:hypothetical protein
MPDGDAHRLPGTFGPGHVVLEAGGHVVGVRWQAGIEGDGRRRAAVEGGGVVDVLDVLKKQLVLSTGRVGGGRGGEGQMGTGECGVVN